MYFGGVADVDVFAEVGEGDDVAGVVVIASFVGDPDFHFCDFGAGGYEGEFGHGFVVAIAEEVSEEEVSVVVVVVDVDFKVGCLDASL